MEEKRVKDRRSGKDRRTVTMDYKGPERRKGERRREERRKVDPRITFI